MFEAPILIGILVGIVVVLAIIFLSSPKASAFLDHLGIEHKSDVSREEAIAELDGLTLTWDMVTHQDAWPWYKRLKNALSMDRVDIRPEGLRFRSSNKISLTEIEEEAALLQIRFSDKIDLATTVVMIEYVSSVVAEVVNRKTEPYRANRLQGMAEQFEKREFPLKLSLWVWPESER